MEFNNQQYPQMGNDPQASGQQSAASSSDATAQAEQQAAYSAGASNSEQQNTYGASNTQQQNTYSAGTSGTQQQSTYSHAAASQSQQHNTYHTAAQSNRQTQSTPRGYTPYTPAYNGDPVAPTRPPKKKKHSNLTAKLVALSLACALVGSVGGGAIVAAVMHNSQDRSSSQSISDTTKNDNVTSQNVSNSTTQEVNSGSMTPSEVYNQNVSAVVGIANEGTTTNAFGQVSATASSGSGFIISEDGYIVTNYHVVEGAQTLTVSLYSGEEYTATYVGGDASSDVALLKIDATGLPAVTIGDSDSLSVGDRVAAIGNPLGELTYTMTVGYISATDREINTDGTPINMLQTDVAINSGNSGGPLFDMNGNVVGITTAKYSGSTSSGTSIEGIGFAIPINDVMNLIPDLKEHGYVTGRPSLGIGVRDLDSTTASVYGLPLGAYVLSVEEGSCAQTAGLQSGDIITALDDTTIESYNDLAAALKNYKAGDTATLTIYRSGQTQTVQVTFDEKAQTDTTTDTQTQEEQQQQQQGSNPFEYFFGR